MKWLYSAALVCILGIYTSAMAGEGFRCFTTQDERDVEARILDYNPSRKTIQLETSTGKKVWLKPGMFCEKDQSYILEWITADQFLSDIQFRITAKKNKKSAGIKGDYIHYTLTLQNRGDVSFEGLKTDARIFYTNNDYLGGEDTESYMSVKVEVDRVPGGERVIYETEPVLMAQHYKTYTETYSENGPYGQNTYTESITKKTLEQDARGIWLRISGPLREGKPVIREFCFPKELEDKVIWEESELDLTGTIGTWKQLFDEAVAYHQGTGVTKDIHKALELYKASFDIEANSEAALKVGGIYLHHGSLRNFSLAEEWMAKAAEQGSGYGYNALAMFYAATKRTEFLNGDKAVEYGLKAVEMVGKEAWVMDTLACAYARQGNFEKAVELQTQAYELVKNDSGSDGYKERLALYEQGLPWQAK